MRLMIHTIQPGDELTMIGPDGRRSERFVLGDLPALRCEHVWLYRRDDAPIVVDRNYGLDSSFELHSRAAAAQQVPHTR
ncbi:hypothetical protein [Jatrophihabitans fulvus]